MHHYPHHIGDYRTHTAHLTMVEDGAYRRLLDLYYMHEKPLPCDLVAVQRLAAARSREERAAVEAVLSEFFNLQDDGWHQGRCDEEIEAYRERGDKARENGKSGGRPKKQKPRHNPAETNPVISGFPKHNPDVTQTEPSGKLTGNREPVLGAPPSGAPPDEPQKSSPVAAREDGPEGADAHDTRSLIADLTAKRAVR